MFAVRARRCPAVNGTLAVLRGSHLDGTYPHYKDSGVEQLITCSETVEAAMPSNALPFR